MVVRSSEIAGYEGRARQESEPLELQRAILRRWVAAVSAERLTYEGKVRHLQRGYRLLLDGLVALAALAGTLVNGAF